MKNLLRAGAVALVLALSCVSAPASAQTANCASYDAAGTCLSGVVLWDPVTRTPYKAAGGTGGSGGDASAANQSSQITIETAIRDQIGGAISSPATYTTNYWLKTINATLGTPLQAGGSIGNASFGITGVTVDANGSLPVANRAAIFWNGATGTGSALTGSATFTGAARDSGQVAAAVGPLTYFNAFFLTDQTGTARVDCSNDNSTWYTCATTSLSAATPLILQVPVMTRYHRAIVVNGSSAETYLWVNTSYTGA